MDPEVAAKLLAKHPSQMTRLSEREREVLALMAEGQVEQRLFIGDKAVSEHCTSILAKLGLPPDEADHRSVLAVLAYHRRRPKSWQGKWPGLGAGPGHPEPRRERTRTSQPLSMSIMPWEP
jgi:DNA-binding CsgD family transcriptional regulator